MFNKGLLAKGNSWNGVIGFCLSSLGSLALPRSYSPVYSFTRSSSSLSDFLFSASCLQSALDMAVSMKDLSIVVDILNIINLQP